MTDIVQKLRRVDPNQALLAAPPHDTSYLQVGLLCHEAAAEIERLRVEVLAEREACAQIVEPSADHRRNPEWYIGGEEAVELLIELAAAIRARGEKP